MTCSHRFRVCDLSFISLVAMLALACSPELEECDDTGQPDFLDMRVDFPPPENGVQFVTPDLELGPYEEKMYCFTMCSRVHVWDPCMLPIQSYYGHHVFQRGSMSKTKPLLVHWSIVRKAKPTTCRSPRLSKHHNDFPQGDGNWLNLLPGYVSFGTEPTGQTDVISSINDQTLLINAAVNFTDARRPSRCVGRRI